MNRVATEIAQKVGVLFEDHDLDSGAGKQKAQHHTRRSSAHDATSSTDLLRCGGCRGAHSEPPAVFREARLFARALARISRTFPRYSFNRASKPRSVGW